MSYSDELTSLLKNISNSQFSDPETFCDVLNFTIGENGADKLGWAESDVQMDGLKNV